MTDTYQERVRRIRKLLGNPYAYLDGDGGYEALPQSGSAASELSGEPASQIETTALLGGKQRGDRFSRQEIEDIARRMQRALWRRHAKRPPHRAVSPLEIVDPSRVLKSLGYEIVADPLLGDIEADDGEVFSVAALLDRNNRQVRYSPHFRPDLLRFTLAHELGHVLLHAGSGQHRDRALDGSRSSRGSTPEETEADMFAAAFLMPARQVRAEFVRRYSTAPLVLTEEAAFGLGRQAPRSTESCRHALADLCRRLAGATHFHGTHFSSLAEHFQVSQTAMAIRLQELELVQG